MIVEEARDDAPPVQVLLVEDDRVGALRLKSGLEAQGFTVVHAESAAAGLERFEALRPDIIVLDIMLPDVSGMKLIQHFSRAGAGVICISAMGETEARLEGLSRGADDYLAKPFNSDELALKLRNLDRRIRQTVKHGTDSSRAYRFDGWLCDRQARRLWSPSGEEVVLTSGEFDLLQVFLESSGICLSREQIMERLGERLDDANDRAVDLAVHRLRAKIERDKKNPEYFVTVYGAGYVFPAKVERSALPDGLA